MILELCVTHLTMCASVQMMHFGCRTYEFTPSYLQNSINSDSAILSCRRCTYKRIPALAVEQNNCALLFYTGRYYLALNTAFLCLYIRMPASRTEAILFNSVTTAETVRSCPGINIKQSKPLLAVAVQLQEHVSSNQFHSHAGHKHVARGCWGSGLRRSRRLLEEIVLDDENINCDHPFPPCAHFQHSTNRFVL